MGASRGGSGYMLNRLTLTINDKEVASQVRERLLQIWESCFTVVWFMVTLNLCVKLFNFVAGSGALFQVMINIGFLGLQFCWYVLKKRWRKHQNKIIVFYAIVHNLVYCLFAWKLIEPETPLSERQKTMNDNALLFNFIIITSV